MSASTVRAQPIVCGIDGSDGSRLAFHEAVVLARALECSVEAVSAWERSTLMYDAYAPNPGPSPKAIAFETLSEVVHGEFAEGVPRWVTLRAELGHPATVLVEASKDAVMLVVGSRGLSGLLSPFLGSVSLYCATQAACPVLVVRPVDDSTAREARQQSPLRKETE